MSCHSEPLNYSPPAITREGDLITCHRCGGPFAEWEGPRCNAWTPRSLAMCFSCLEAFYRETWERGF